MATDVVGYSKLMQSDEAAALAALAEVRNSTQQHIELHQGRIANTAGDSVLGEFGSAVEAVESIKKDRFDVFLTDCNIPGVDALETSGHARKINPDMAVIGNFVGAAGHNTIAPEPAMQVREAEASFQAIADPYARGDFFLSFGESGVDLEEGYLTFPAVPGGLLVKVGKMRASFGKVNTSHAHTLTWVDRPLVTTNLLGGEDGINDAGFSVARLIPNPWIFLEATGQVYRGDSEGVFHSSTRGDLSYVGHLRGYHDVTENTNLDLGGSYARGHNDSGLINGTDVGRFVTDLYGFDATLRWRPLQRAIYRSFIARSELAWSRRQQPDGLQSSFGYYVSGDYQLARRWFGGVRYDRSDRAEAQALQGQRLFDRATSFIITYWPSEFGQIRGQYRHTTYAEGSNADELLFQFQYSIGAHGAHPF